MLGVIQNSTPGRAIRCLYVGKSTVYHEIQQYQTPSPWEYIFVAAPPLYIYIHSHPPWILSVPNPTQTWTRKKSSPTKKAPCVKGLQVDGKGIPFSFPFGARGIFRGKLAVSLPEATFLRHFLFNFDQVAFLF